MLMFKVLSYIELTLFYINFADFLLDEMLESIERRSFSPDFPTGLTGFGWGIEYLIKNRFAEGDSDELLEDIDKKIINWFEALKKSKDNNKYKAYTSDSALFSIGLEPYYPVNTDKNNTIYQKYKALSDKETKIYFGGRLGSYKYYDMDQVVERALELYERLQKSL